MPSSPIKFSTGTRSSSKNSSVVVVSANQGGLSLPNRDYYTKTDPASERIRTAYLAHIARTLALLGDSPDAAKASADRIMALETKLAAASRTPVQLRDPLANYNPMAVTALNEMTPAFDWNAFMSGLGVNGIATVVIGQPEFFKALNSALTDTPVEDWKAYLRWRLVNRMSPYLSSDFVNASFAFQSTLTGAREQLPRWRRWFATRIMPQRSPIFCSRSVSRS